jgi:TonB family protein
MRLRAACIGLAIALSSATAFAQTEPDPTPPSLVTRAEATYPEEAKKQRLEGKVGLDLVVGEDGKVTDAKVTEPAGHGFDEAAIAAAKQFTFEPARQGGKAIKSVVQFTYEFHLPPPEPPPTPPAPPPSLPPPPPPDEVRQSGASTLVLAQRPISAASSSTVRDRDFQLRPIGSVQDILRVTPGLVIVQHSGGGKANQYFLRGFDVDHGTDLALSIDGIPINMVSHAHGQGFSDTNFIIPEVVEKVEISKGPYFAHQGDFATAGAVNMVSRDDFEHSSVGFGVGGSPGHGAPAYRGLLIASPHFGPTTKATFAAEIGRQNGPFDNPENFDKYKLFNKVTFEPTPRSTLQLGEMSYGGAWHGSGQIPARAVEQGLVSRYGSIDPDEGGYTSRHQLFVNYKIRPNDESELKALAYIGTYRFNLFSNFTLYARDQKNGDEIEQVDRRVFYGGRVSYRVVNELCCVKLDTTIGADARSDDIRGELWNTVHRRQLANVRASDMHETLMGAFVNEEITPAKWIRADVGGRADMMAFAVDDRIGTSSGTDSAHQFSPKASMALSPLREDPAQVDFYVNWGHGFHSNDVRGAFTTPKVTPLTRAIGEEVGTRGRFFDRWDIAAALWQLDLDNETVWIGDEGTTEVSGATTRRGVEIETRYELTKWLAADLDLTFTKSQFRENAGNGNGLALAPKQTWSGGLSARHEAGPGVARGGFRFYGIGDRPATDDGALEAPGFTLFDVHVGYRLRRFDLAFDVENLFDAKVRSAQFATTGRLRQEPAIGAPMPSASTCGSAGRLAAPSANGGFGGCEDVHFTPQYPLTMRLMATFFLD